MKKFVIICLIILAIICLLVLANGCVENPRVEDVKYSENSLFTIVEYNNDLGFYIVYMNETKVMYAISTNTWGRQSKGVFTLLVNKDGSPLIYSEKTIGK